MSSIAQSVPSSFARARAHWPWNRILFLAYLLSLCLVPLLALMVHALRPGLDVFARAVGDPTALDAITLSATTSLAVMVIDAVFGTLLAWVLVRYRFFGRRFFAAAVDLPLAIPTLVAGITIALLYGPTSAIGRTLGAAGFPVLYRPAAILLALAFVTLPLVVRAVEPLIEALDPAEEEAARLLGASRFTILRRIIAPALAPAIASGSLRALARALGEFGALIVVSGNIPGQTLTAPVYVFGELESGHPHAASSVSVVLVLVSLGLSLLAGRADRRAEAARG